MAAGDPVIKGSTDLTKQPDIELYTPEEGTATESTWIGPPAAVDAKVTELKAADHSPARIEIQRGIPSTVKAYFPYQNAQGKVELIPEVFEKRLETFPRWAIGEGEADMIEQINAAIAEGKAAATDWDAKYTTDGGVFGSGFNEYRDLRLLGVDSYYAHTYRLRWTLPVAPNANEEVAFDGVGEVWTYQDMISYISLTMLIPIKWQQPKVVCYAAPVGFVLSSINEWLMFPPSCEKSGNNYFVTAEWLGAESWSSTLYDGGSHYP